MIFFSPCNTLSFGLLNVREFFLSVVVVSINMVWKKYDFFKIIPPPPPSKSNDQPLAAPDNSIRNKTQTAVINMAIKKRIFENKVHLLDVSYVWTYIFRNDHYE